MNSSTMKVIFKNVLGLLLISGLSFSAISYSQDITQTTKIIKRDSLVGDKSREKDFVSPQRISQLETFVETNMLRLKLPGLAIGVIEDGKVLHLKGYGFLSDKLAKTTPYTTFKLGSVTKSFTAIAISQLAEEGKLNFDAEVIQYLPWFRTSNPQHSSLIKVKHLLNHTSGFSTYDGNRNQVSEDKSAEVYEKAVRELAEFKLVSSPGERFQYSNVNYQILGLLLEKLENESYEKIISKRIFKPLQMSDSYLDKTDRKTNSESSGHLYSFGSPVENVDNLGRVTLAQSGVYASASDMLIYLGELLKHDNQLISAKTTAQMFSVNGDKYSRGYGYGWFIGQLGKKQLIFHDGRSPGYTSSVALLPSENIGLVVLANASDSFGDKDIGRFVVAIADIILGHPPREIEPLLIEKVLLWSIFLIAIILTIQTIRLIFKIVRKIQPKKLGRTRKILRFCATFIIPTMIIYVLLKALPDSYGVALDTVALNEPTLYFGMMFCSISAAIFMLLQIIIRRKQGQLLPE